MLTATLPVMAKRKPAEQTTAPERFFVRADPEVRKRLAFLALDAGSTPEKLGGQLLADAVNRLWSTFDPKRKAH
jgi:hypothetical protein